MYSKGHCSISSFCSFVFYRNPPQSAFTNSMKPCIHSWDVHPTLTHAILRSHVVAFTVFHETSCFLHESHNFCFTFSFWWRYRARGIERPFRASWLARGNGQPSTGDCASRVRQRLGKIYHSPTKRAFQCIQPGEKLWGDEFQLKGVGFIMSNKLSLGKCSLLRLNLRKFGQKLSHQIYFI